jgi:hypothetical protein
MTTEELAQRMADWQANLKEAMLTGQVNLRDVVNSRYLELDGKVELLRAELRDHRIEAAKAISACNSRIDTLTNWMVSGLGAALLALVMAIASWFSPRPH